MGEGRHESSVIGEQASWNEDGMDDRRVGVIRGKPNSRRSDGDCEEIRPGEIKPTGKGKVGEKGKWRSVNEWAVLKMARLNRRKRSGISRGK